MKYFNPLIFSLLILFSFFSCKKNTSENTSSGAVTDIKDLVVDPNFTFNTDRPIELKLSDPSTSKIKYHIYAVYDNENEMLIATGQPSNGIFDLDMVIPDFCDRLKVVRNENGKVTTKVIDATGDQALSSFKRSSSATNNCSELLYAVNGQGGFYTIDVESGSYTATPLANLVGGGSIACAVNKDSGIVYYNTGTTLRYHDYNTSTFHVAHTGNPFNGSYPRMEYNHTNGHLYIAKNEDMHILDPLTNTILSSYSIVGLESPVGGGDVAISDDGTVFMCCFSGLYRIDISNDTAYATRISAENLPFQPTSMAIDRNDRLYLATNNSNSQLIEMDKVDGAWSVVKTYNHKINDLGSYKCDISQLANVDTDGDGVIDAQDDYPNDSTASHNIFTPSDIGWGSMAFEDLWPSKGDYDFNDLVINYRFTQVANSSNEVVRLIARFKVKAIGASFHNGFGFKMDINPNLISSVTGFNHTDGVVNVDSKGLESGHSNGSTIIVFDDAFNNIPSPGAGWFVNTQENAPEVVGNEIEIIIEFTSPIAANQVGTPPYNPFIFINGDRGKEIHLADYAPTDLANSTYFNTIHDDSSPNSGRYYRTENNLPWGINIIHEFRHPLEKVSVDRGYNHFVNWASSNGVSYKDWYKDNSGYRNTARLYIK